MKTTAPQPTPRNLLYLADTLTEVAGVDFDVQLDQFLTDESLPLQWRQEIAAQRDDLIREVTEQIGVLRGHIDRRHKLHGERQHRTEVEAAQQERRDAEHAAAEKTHQLEKAMLDMARRRAEDLGVVLEPCRVQHIHRVKSVGFGNTAIAEEVTSWRVTAPRSHPIVKALPSAEHLIPTVDGTALELHNSSLRSCCAYIAQAAAAQRDTDEKDAPKPGLFRRRKETP